MTYLVGQILLCLLLAALLGGIIGWLWRAIFARRDVDAAGSRVGTLTSDLERTNSSLNGAQEELAGALEELADARNAVEKREGELSARNGRISELEAKIGEQEMGFQEEIAASVAVLEAAQSEIVGLTGRYDELKVGADSETKKLGRQLEEAKEAEKKALTASQLKLDTQAGELKAANGKVAELEKRLASAQADAQKGAQELEARVKAADQARAEAETQADGGSEKLQALEADLSARDEKIATLEQRATELGSARARIEELEGRLSAQGDADTEWRGRLEQCETANRRKDQRIDELERRLAAPTPTPPTVSPQVAAGPTAEEAAAAAARGERPAEIDDLKKIFGIGPVLEKLLHGLGVFTFRQIAHWTPTDVDWVDSRLEEFPGRIVRDDWAGGARKEHQKKYGEEA